MSKASTLTFIEQLKSGKIANDRMQIYLLIKKHPGANINRIGLSLGLTKIVVGARISELRALGVIYISKCRTKSKTHLSEYMIQENEEIISINAREVRKEHFMKWLKKGKEFAEFLDPMTNEVIEHFYTEGIANNQF